MKFTINRTAFTAQITNVSHAIPSKATIPILTGLKISASQDGITLIGSDAEISIESFLPVSDESFNLTIEEEGSVVVTARLFNDVIRKLPTNTVMIEVDQKFNVKISSGKAQFDLNGIDGNSYPRLPEIISDERLLLPTALFKELIAQTIISTSNQETRPILTGINIHLEDSMLTGAATDSHRLSRRQITIDNPQQLSIESMTIPKKTLNELSRIVQNDQDIQFIISDEQLIFVVENLTIYSRILEGNYPDVDRLIPTEYNTRLIVNADTFFQAIDRASIISHQGKNNFVRLDVQDGHVTISVPGSQSGTLNEDIEVIQVEGNNLQISFNPDYMKDALRTFNGVDIQIDFITNIRPILLTAVEEENDTSHLLQLLTPIRTH